MVVARMKKTPDRVGGLVNLILSQGSWFTMHDIMMQTELSYTTTRTVVATLRVVGVLECTTVSRSQRPLMPRERGRGNTKDQGAYAYRVISNPSERIPTNPKGSYPIETNGQAEEH